jgi:hypothetical protein
MIYAYLGLIGLLITLNYVVRNSFVPMKLIVAMFWVVPFVWTVTSGPSPFTPASQLNTVMLVLIIGIFLISLFGAFRRPLQINTIFGNKNEQRGESYDNGSWHLPSWMKVGESEEKQIAQTRIARSKKLQERRARFRKALNPEDRED